LQVFFFHADYAAYAAEQELETSGKIFFFLFSPLEM